MSQEEQEKDEHAQDLTAGGAGRSSAPDTRGAEEDLPPDLKAIEAELASLSPRTDRLDRERLIFLAGQQSVASGDISPARHGGHWGWPAAFAAMTAVAATLLAMLLLWPETPGEVRFVEVPVESPGDHDLATDGKLPARPPEDRRVEPSPEPREPSAEPVPRSSLFALVGLEWMQRYDRDRFSPDSRYPRLLDQVLAEGIDSWPSPAPVGGAKRASAPVPYRELLNQELGNPASNSSGPERPLINTLLYPGVNS